MWPDSSLHHSSSVGGPTISLQRSHFAAIVSVPTAVLLLAIVLLVCLLIILVVRARREQGRRDEYFQLHRNDPAGNQQNADAAANLHQGGGEGNPEGQ